MNRIYRLVWNRTLKVLQVASELTRSKTGSADGAQASRPIGARSPLFLACAATLALGSATFAMPVQAASTYTVTKSTDDGTGATTGSLSWAIIQANADPGSLIVIQLTGGNGSITETGSLPSLTANTDISGTLQIIGAGSAPLLNSGTGSLLRIGTGSAGSVTGNIGTSGNGGSGGNAVALGDGSSLDVAANGSVQGGAGGAGGGTIDGTSGNGGSGGNAVALGDGSSLDVAANGSVQGGAGGAGGGTGNGTSGNGGSGGNAVTSSGSFTLTNAGTIAGGIGGAAGTNNGSGDGGKGGLGGKALDGAGFKLTNTGTIVGGQGGQGGQGDSIRAGDGGNGGTALDGTAFNVTNTGTIVGGQGGNGGNSSIPNDGGNGGTALDGTGFNVTNTGTIVGGQGGKGGNGVTTDDGGNGGTAINGSGFTLTNQNGGQVNGGTGGSAGSTFGQGLRGQDGAAVVSTGNSHVTNAGTINGSTAVSFSGGGNTLTLVVGSTTTGKITSTSGSINGGDTLVLVDNASGGGSNIQNISGLSGFSTYKKAGTATWVLTGTGGDQNWQIQQGALQGDATAFADDLTFVPQSGDSPAVVFDQGSSNDNSPTTGTYSHVISGDGSVRKIDDGTLIFSGANTYTGGTTIDAGTLQGNTTSLQGDIVDNASLIFDQGSAGTFAGIVSGTGALTKTGAGVLTLTGANTYGGGTTITTGTLQGNTASLQGNIVNNASLVFDQGSDDAFAGVVSGLGALTKTGAGTLLLTGTNTYSGGTIISGGKLQGNTTSLQGDIVDNASLVFDQGRDGTFAGVISGSGSVNVLFGSLLHFTNTNTYSGSTTIASQTLLELGDGGTTGSVAGNITNNGNLAFNRSDDVTFGNVISGSGNLIQEGSGTLILTGANTYTGITAIDGGTLQIGNGGTSGSIVGDVTDTGSLAFNRSDAVTFGNVISGSGSLSQIGSGTLTLTGANTYRGTTTINAGTLALTGSSSLASSRGVTDNGTFDLSGTTAGATIKSLAGHGSVALGSQTLTLSNAYGTFSGDINGTGGLALTGGVHTLTGANTYSGGTAIDGGTLQIGNGGTSGSIVGDVTDNGSLAFNRSDAVTFGNVISGSGKLIQAGSGTLTLTGANTYSGGTIISGGKLQGNTTSVQGDIFDSASLVFDQGSAGTFAGVVSGTGALTKTGAGVLALTGANTYSGGTTITTGTLQGDTASLQGDIVDNASLVFNQNTVGTFAGVISGTGSLTQVGTGTLALNGFNNYSGLTDVRSGKLVVGSDTAHASARIGGDVQVIGGATLGGHGTIAGDVDIASGAHLAPGNSIGTLTIGGNLTAAQGSVLDFEFGAPGATSQTAGTGDSVHIGGNLELDGSTLNVANAGGFGAGLYNVFTYGGTLTETNGGVTLGATPSGQTLSIQNLTASKQINLINSTGVTLNFWNANGKASATELGGGSGTWSTIAANWTDATGSVTASMQPQPGFAVFAGDAGTVSVDNNSGADPVSAKGLQFVSNGYTLNGDTLTLVGDNGNAPVVRVGDGSTAGADYTATLTNVLAGTDGLIKTDLGTLVLTGANTYTGGTTIDAGTLQGNTTSLQGDIVDNASLVFDQGSAGTFAGVVSGTGALTKTGAGVLALTGANTYSGGTTITTGTLQGNTASLQGDIVNNASLVFDQGSAGTFAGVVSGTGALTKTGAGVLTLTGANTYGGGTTITTGTLQGNTTSLQGDIVNNASLVFDQGSAGTFAGVISGTGALTKTGAGVLTLTGANTYSGGTTITTGTLQGNTASLQGDIVNNASLVFDQGSAGTFAGVVSGTGALTKTGAGVLTLTGANTYGGGTTITTGTLQGNTTSLQGDIVNNASLVFDQGSAGTFAGVISGTGALTKTGAGVLTLTGANTYSGGTTITTGTLQGNTASLQGNIVDNAALVFDQGSDGTFAGVISDTGATGTGTLTKTGAGVLTLTGVNTYSGGTTLTTGTLLLGNAWAISDVPLAMADNTTLDFANSFALVPLITLSGDTTFNVGSGITTTLSSPISDGTQPGELVKTGAGTLIMAGHDTYTGPTEVAAGTLEVDTPITSSVSVDSGATLSGDGGMMGGMTIRSGATVSPGGNNIGTLTVNGNVSMASGASYQVTALDIDASDQIHATGTATLGGASVVVLAGGTHWAAATRYTIVTADGGVSGHFGAATSNFAFLTPTLFYDADHAYLTLMRNIATFPSVGITANEVHTAAAVEALGSSSAVYNAVLPLAAGPARAAFNTLAGDSLASTRTAIIDDSHYVRDAISNHLQGLLGTGDLSRQTEEGSVWTSAWGHGDNHDSDGNASLLSSIGSGVLIGADRNLDTWRLGAVVGKGQLSDSTDAGADAHSTSTHLGLYSAVDLGAWQVQGGVAQSAYRTQSRRHIDVARITGVASARYDNRVTQAFVDGGYRFQWAHGNVMPYVNLAQVWIHQDAINEAGNAGALTVQADGAHLTYGTAGVRDVFASTAVTQLYANVGLQHAWGNLASINQQTFASSGTDRFSVAGLPVARNAGIVDIGARFSVAKNVWIDAGYHGQFASHATDQSARMSLDINF